MPETASAPKRAFAVTYKELRRWSVGSFFKVAWGWPAEDIKPIASALVRKRLRARDVPVEERPRSLLTLHFDGSMMPRDNEPNEVTGGLFVAGAQDVVFSKIDVRNGAIGVVPADSPPFAVTTEYPVYVVRTDVALPAYIQLLFRTEYFRAALNSKISGHSGRKRINPGELEEVEVPLPDVNVQEQIIGRWQAARDALFASEGRLRALIDEVDAEVRAPCSSSLASTLYGREVVVRAQDLRRWDLNGARAARYRETHPSFCPLGDFVVDATELTDPAAEPDHLWPVFGVNNKQGVFFSHAQLGRSFNASYKRIRKDWFFHNPTRANVGSLGIVPDVPDDAITSPEYQVWRIEEGMLPGFAAVLIATSLFIELIQIHRVGAVKQRLFVDNLREILVPAIAAPRQLEIASRRDEVLGEIQSDRLRLDEATAEVERVITRGAARGA